MPSAPVVCAHTASGAARSDRRRRHRVPARPAFVRRAGARARARASTGATTRPRAGCSRTACCGEAPAARRTRVLLLLAADLAETIRRRLSMFVLRAKVDDRRREGAPRAARRRRRGGGDAARDALGVASRRWPRGRVRRRRHGARAARSAASSSRAAASAPIVHAALARHASDRPMPTRGAGSASRPACRGSPPPRRTCSCRRRANWDLLGGVSFQKGCYPGQEIVARMQYLGRLKERLYAFRTRSRRRRAPATRLYSAAFGDQPCGTVVNAAPDPAGGSVLLAVVQIAAVDARRPSPRRARRPAACGRAAAYAVPRRAARRACRE